MCNSPELREDVARIQMQLPLEIWEVILKYLPFLDLMKASSVCYQWRQLARRISHERCLNLPTRLLLELIHEYNVTSSYVPSPTRTPTPTPSSSPVLTPLSENVDPMDSAGNESREYFRQRSPLSPSPYSRCVWMRESVDWIALSKMMMQTEVTKDSSHCVVVCQIEKLTHLSAAGHFVVCVSRGLEGTTSVLRLFGVDGVELALHNFSGRVHKVCIIKSPNTPSLLAVCVDRELKCYLPVASEQILLPLSICPSIDVDSRMCCDGTTLVISELVGDNQLALYEATPCVQQMRVELQLKCRIHTSSSPLFWDLWNGFVTVVLSGGHVTTYTKTGGLVGESPMYKDLRYPNPTVLSHGLVFASTITSRTLLAYWHMARDRDYWLVGRSVIEEWIHRGEKAIGNTSNTCDDVEMREAHTSEVQSQIQLSSVCILTLAKIRIGSAVMLETTVVYYKRGLVFCGTDQGQLLVYRVFAEDKTKCPKINIPLLESSLPYLCMAVAARPISRIAAFFSDSQITVAIGDRIGKGYIVSIPNINKSPL